MSRIEIIARVKNRLSELMNQMDDLRKSGYHRPGSYQKLTGLPAEGRPLFEVFLSHSPESGYAVCFPQVEHSQISSRIFVDDSDEFLTLAAERLFDFYKGKIPSDFWP